MCLPESLPFCGNRAPLSQVLDSCVRNLPNDCRLGVVTISDRVGLVDLTAPLPHVQFVDMGLGGVGQGRKSNGTAQSGAGANWSEPFAVSFVMCGTSVCASRVRLVYRFCHVECAGGSTGDGQASSVSDGFSARSLVAHGGARWKGSHVIMGVSDEDELQGGTLTMPVRVLLVTALAGKHVCRDVLHNARRDAQSPLVVGHARKGFGRLFRRRTR